MKRVVLFFFLTAVFVFPQPKVPALTQWATDFTDALNSSELSNLNSILRAYEDSTSNQLVVVVMPTLDGYPIENFAYEIAKQNKVGTKNNDNGIVFLIAKNDRLLRIEVGYGLEGSLPDALASQIIRNDVVPYFKSDNYYAGIFAGIESIISATSGEYRSSKKKKDGFESFEDYIPVIFFLLSGFAFFARGGKRRGIFIGGIPGGFGGGGFGKSGGFGGGGFSGGGGSFGGGGSSGSW